MTALQTHRAQRRLHHLAYAIPSGTCCNGDMSMLAVEQDKTPRGYASAKDLGPAWSDFELVNGECDPTRRSRACDRCH